MDTKFNLTKAVCRDVRAAVCAARKWPKSRTIDCVMRRRQFETAEYTKNALLWFPSSFVIPPLRRQRLLGEDSAGTEVILTFPEWEGMCALELECRTGRGPSALTQTYRDTGFVLLSRDGEVLEARINNWGELCRFAAEHKPNERENRLTRERWTDAISRWRKRAGMLKTKVPLGIVADYAQDRDDGQEDAVLIRAAIAANFKG